MGHVWTFSGQKLYPSTACHSTLAQGNHSGSNHHETQKWNNLPVTLEKEQATSMKAVNSLELRRTLIVDQALLYNFSQGYRRKMRMQWTWNLVPGLSLSLYLLPQCNFKTWIYTRVSSITSYVVVTSPVAGVLIAVWALGQERYC